MKRIFIAVVLCAGPSLAFADNVGNCGWGSKLFDGSSGPAPQVLAVTTNGILGNQTFGISSGTSGCTQDGVVKSNWQTAMFIDGNKERLARDMSIGHGETLDALAKLMGVSEQDRATFNRATQQNLARIFPSDDVATERVLLALKEILAADRQLAQYAASI